jgi:hypothetical protein
MSNLPSIGFDRRIELEWLEFVLAKVAEGKAVDEIRQDLASLLEGRLATSKTRGTREKTITVLTRLWANVHPELKYVRDSALELLKSSTREQRLVLHWAMAIATYPFFGDVAQHIGRLLNIQGDAALTSLRKRMAEEWGDRPTVKIATRRIARSMEQWGLLTDKKRGSYLPPTEKITVMGEYALLLTEARLISGSRDAMSVDEIISLPAFFPFSILVDTESFRTSKRFEVYRQGNHNMVELSQEAKASPPGSTQAGIP